MVYVSSAFHKKGCKTQAFFYQLFEYLWTFCTVCPRRSDPFYVVAYNIKWVTTSWTDGIYKHWMRECIQ